jgi:hypothetical protein
MSALRFVHRVHNVKLRQPLVPDLAPDKVVRDDSHRLAARLQHCVREHTHQTHIAAAIHQPNVASHQFRAHLLSGSAVLWAAAGTGAAENADSSHAAILRLAAANEGNTSEHIRHGYLAKGSVKGSVDPPRTEK